MSLPLEGVRVLDLTNIMAGPYCSMVLGDMGAEVIKIESFDGDTTRGFEPHVNGESYCYAVINRNKKSVAIDLKEERGREIATRLAARADILLESFRPGAVRKLGLDYETLRKTNPKLIYASISGYGQTGPYAGKGGFDIVAQGMSGILKMTGSPGGRPVKVGIAMNDIAAGVTTLYGVLGAYVGRLRNGTGQYLETSLLEAGLAWTMWEFAAFFGSGELPTATGTRHRRSAPYQAYRSKDGYVTVGANGEKLWCIFCTMVCEKPEWLDDPRFATQSLRVRHADELEQEVEKVLGTQPTAYWVDKLDAAKIPGGPVYTYDEVMQDPQVNARDMVVDIGHPIIGPMKVLGLPIKSTGELTAIRGPAPWLGQHSEEVLREIGYAEEEVRQLFRDGVVLDRRRGMPLGRDSSAAL
jgi:crotonobetainyl-CoA:carnitine CoA-transferase CaiB-like acyl-CoA transferase